MGRFWRFYKGFQTLVRVEMDLFMHVRLRSDFGHRHLNFLDIFLHVHCCKHLNISILLTDELHLGYLHIGFIKFWFRRKGSSLPLPAELGSLLDNGVINLLNHGFERALGPRLRTILVRVDDGVGVHRGVRLNCFNVLQNLGGGGIC
jgi:hypothetical protein